MRHEEKINHSTVRSRNGISKIITKSTVCVWLCCVDAIYNILLSGK